MLNAIFNIEEHVLITFIASFLIWLMVGGVIYLWVYQKKFSFGNVVNVLLAMLFAWTVSELLKMVFPSQRPFVANGQTPLTFTWPIDSSFPSAHASSAFALATSLRKSDKRLFSVYIIFAILVAFGRVLSRVHYFIDVFAGALIGIFVVFVLEKFALDKLFKKFLA
jgi:undecaprenyl-diphosphatase